MRTLLILALAAASVLREWLRANLIRGIVGSTYLLVARHARALPQTMRAAAFDHGGGPEVLTIHQVPVPVPNAGEVLIAVHGAGVAVWEADFRQHPSERMRFPAVLGGDVGARRG